MSLHPVVVFVDVDDDIGDPETVAEKAVSQSLRRVAADTSSVLRGITATTPDGRVFFTEVLAVHHLSYAVANGYLDIVATGMARPRRNKEKDQ